MCVYIYIYIYSSGANTTTVLFQRLSGLEDLLDAGG